ncbi:hypothetical protein [Shewanella surugensis]|uniref:Cobalt transporter n=1 Tax=Shewanella surugensis TaxID=212020 RepID=A0ABT0LI12_9GAMM|nr:hypothetical protein [Shewanella surugensis]MCL1127334.1 hypothetical protein [Shewanella surugensis]
MPNHNVKFTRTILLVILVCQLLTLTQAFSVQYPNGLHPMGTDIDHHHSHDYHEQKQPDVNPLKPVPHQQYAQTSLHTGHSISLVQSDNPSEWSDAAEHEHTNHAHTPVHPSIESVFVSPFFHSDTLFDDVITYQNCLYTPPLPPPHGFH